MKITMVRHVEKLMDYVAGKNRDEDAQLTNGEVEDNIDRDNKPFIAFYMPYEHRVRFNGVKGQVDIPISENIEAFTSEEELENHIKNNRRTERSRYFFDRNDESVRETVLNAFHERRCEKLRDEKRSAERRLEEKKEKLEELDCDRDA